jgi:hypothetical protein
MTSFGMPSAWPFAVLVPSQDPSLKKMQRGSGKLETWAYRGTLIYIIII